MHISLLINYAFKNEYTIIKTIIIVLKYFNLKLFETLKIPWFDHELFYTLLGFVYFVVLIVGSETIFYNNCRPRV